MNPVNQQWLDVGMTLGTYIMGVIAEQGHPMTPTMGRKLKEASVADLQSKVGDTVVAELLKMIEPYIQESLRYVEQQEEL